MLSMTNRYQQISPQKVQEISCGTPTVRIVDVRNKWEYILRHLAGSLLMPMDEFAARCQTELSQDEEIIVVCEHGIRSETAARYLASLGYANVATMIGGMAAYEGLVEEGV
jgi:rhodanese-related sulfurtransferase